MPVEASSTREQGCATDTHAPGAVQYSRGTAGARAVYVHRAGGVRAFVVVRGRGRQGGEQGPPPSRRAHGAIGPGRPQRKGEGAAAARESPPFRAQLPDGAECGCDGAERERASVDTAAIVCSPPEELGSPSAHAFSAAAARPPLPSSGQARAGRTREDPCLLSERAPPLAARPGFRRAWGAAHSARPGGRGAGRLGVVFSNPGTLQPSPGAPALRIELHARGV
eukprot:scaffold1971_cov374-Prasinococcus_capsulatus_cf.AAC.1